MIRRVIRRLFPYWRMDICRLWPSLLSIGGVRRALDIQLTSEELRAIIRVLRKKSPCRFLVFGVGNDSILWSRLNRRGDTQFLEDNEMWLSLVVKKHSQIKGCLVRYPSHIEEWGELMETPSRLHMQLPDGIRDEPWDIILVDAPEGWKPESPGRMMSIYAASELAGPSTDIFVHDCNRQVEQVYCDRFLGGLHLVEQVHWLRHYRT
jgi:glucuronoxylan 4-O-methyltransferase